MKNVIVRLKDVSKSFNRRSVLSGLNATLQSPGSLAITGRNGSGKSTLARIIAGVMDPSRGSVELEVDGRPVDADDRYLHIGFVAPYVSLYDEFSARENVEMLTAMRSGESVDGKRLDALFDLVGLADRQGDRLGTYSSGMKQRVKYVFALIHEPPLLILDEPTANLDEEGSAVVASIVAEQRTSAAVIVATNESSEAAWCSGRIDLHGRR